MDILLLILLAVGTVFLVFFLFLLIFKADSNHEKEVAHFTHRSLNAKFSALKDKYVRDTAVLEKLTGYEHTLRKLFHNPASSEKKAIKIQKSINKLESGNYNGINFLVLPGYGLLKMFNITGDQRFFINLVKLYSDLSGREFAIQNTRHLLASIFSLLIGGVGGSMVFGIFFMGIGIEVGQWIAYFGAPFSILLAYALYEEVKSKSKKRKEAITADFAQVVTKMALLISSGMETFLAWDEVCSPPERDGPLYHEMRQTIAEINKGGFSPEVALEGFIKRCGTKDTTRLGASIIQNLTRGNDELSLFLSELSLDVWADRKHNARRLGEAARSKLMLPMVIIFIGIILLIAVPIMISMGEMGM